MSARSLFPGTDLEWEDAESAALTLGEVIGPRVSSSEAKVMHQPFQARRL